MKFSQETYDVLWDALSAYLKEAEKQGNSELIQEIKRASEVIEFIGIY